MRIRLLVIALLCALASLTAACSSSHDAKHDKAVHEPFASYVALGDSYVSGPLIAPSAKGAPSACLRSGSNYPSYLAVYLKVKTFTDVSCGGATTDDLYAPQRGGLGRSDGSVSTNLPQLDALKPSTDLVTLGIGGNDFGLFTSLVTSSLGRTDLEEQLAHADAIQPRVEKAIAEIRKRSPHAKIVVTGYLRAFGTSASCPAVPFSASDRQRTDRIEQRINTSLKRAATAQGAIFVDSYALSAGHDICAGKNAWVNGPENILFVAAAYHPFRSGMDAVARGVYMALTGKKPSASPSLKTLAALPR